MGPASRRSPARRLRATGLGAVLALLLSGCGLPNLDEERAADTSLPQTSFVYDADGRLLTALHAEQNRVLIPPGRIPQSVKDAVVAVEDQRFWTHAGIDLKALLRAAYANATEGRVVQGGSTITQQYIKNTIVGPERTIQRKVREALLAYQLERRLSKEQILGRYLNAVYFGRGAYGIQQAARSFFSRPARRLTLPQSALLAGLIASPATFDPVDHPEAALARRNEVLQRMRQQGMLDAAAYADARRTPIRLNLEEEVTRYPAAHFVEYVKSLILGDRRFGQTYTQRYNLLFGGGLRIETTIDLDLQRAAEEAIDGILAQPGDPYGSLVAIDPRTGAIRAMVGGRDFFATEDDDPFAQVNLATGGITGRQAGSAFKPFALVGALESGISPQQVYAGGTSITMSDPVCRTSPTEPWRVENYEGSSYGSLTLEQATIQSVNVVYAQLIRDIGPDRVVEVAKRMGIRSPLRAYCSAVLGSNEVSPLDMAAAYGTLANEGVRVPPVAIARITDASGKVLYDANPRQIQAVEPGVAWTTSQILRKVILYGTGRSANIGRPAAGKTGTAQQWRDAWFVGYVPQLVAATWVGFPSGQISMVPPTTRIRVTGGSFPAQIWRAFMQVATEDMPVLDFDRPESDVVTLAVDTTRSCIATAHTPPEVVKVVQYPSGTEPTEFCPDPAPPPLTEVPSVIGLPVLEAADVLGAVALGIDPTEEYVPGARDGTVLRQDPAPGDEVAEGTAVSVVVSTVRPPAGVVPDVYGLREEVAAGRLVAAGYEVVIEEAPEHDVSVKPGRVVGQTPVAGEEHPPGTTVILSINPDP